MFSIFSCWRVKHRSLFNYRLHLIRQYSKLTFDENPIFKDIEPIEVEKGDFDDVTLRSDDLPRFDPHLTEYLFALFWGLRWLLSKTAILGPLLNF